MKRLFGLIGLWLAICSAAFAAAPYQQVSGWVEKGGGVITVGGQPPTHTKWMQSFPGATVTVYFTGTTVLAPIFSNSNGTSKANPFVSDTQTGFYTFFVDTGVYDLRFSGGGIPSPFTFPGVAVKQGGSSGGGGTVTSVGMTGDGVIYNTAVPGSPITLSGILVPSLIAQNANLGLFGPASGAAATPTWRSVVKADLPVTTVYTDQSNIFTTGTQNFSAAAHLFAPTGAGFAGTANGEIGFNTTGNDYVGFANGSPSIFASFNAALAPVNAHCVNWIVSGGNYLLGDAGVCDPTAGTVTSVAMTVPSWLSVTGTPITTSGTLAVAAATGQTSHRVIGTGSGSTFVPTTLTTGDLPFTYTGNTTLLPTASGSFTVGDCAKFDASGNIIDGGACGAAVTSVGLTASSGFQITNSPITTSGNIGFAMPTGWTTGSLLVGNGANSVTNLGIGINGTCLLSNGTTTLWGSCTGGATPGTVTSFSAGNLSPFFTTSVATASTTPALTFSASTAGAHNVLGNFTGSTAAPTYGALTTAELPFTYTGNTTKLGTSTGTLTNGHCVSIDSNQNFVDSGSVGCGGGGGGGSVSSFSAGNLSPLFTTSVATSTTTPALTFTGVSQSQNLFFASPDGTSGLPTFRGITAGDIPFVFPPSSGPACYAAWWGSDTTGNGLSWSTAYASAMACYDALPTAGGNIFLMDGGTTGRQVSICKSTDPAGCGFWIAGNRPGSPDPNFAAISPGLNVTDVAAAVGSNTTYTVTSAPSTLTATKPKITFDGSGLSGSNTGTFTCTSNTLTTVTCTNASGTLQSGLTGITAKLAGWRVAKTSVAIIGVAGSCNSAFSQYPQTCLVGGGNFSTADATHPVMWLSDVFSHAFYNLSAGFPSKFMLLGIGSDNNILSTSPIPPASWNNRFVNVGFRSNSAIIAGTSYGPAVTIGSNSDWNSFEYDQFSANATDSVTLSGCSRVSPTTTCTVLNAGNIVTATLGSSGGTGYAVNDILTVVQGGASGGTVKVTGVSGGVVTTYSVQTVGTSYATASNLATTGGGGSGALVTITTGTWPSGWSSTKNLGIEGCSNDNFNGMHLAATVASATTVTYPDTGAPLSCTGGKISSDEAQAMIVNPAALTAFGSGIFNIVNPFINGGGIRYYAGNQGAQVNIFGPFQESGFSPAVDIVGCNQIASENQVRIDTIFVADNVVTPLPGARYDKANTPCGRSVSASNTTTAGPFTLGPGAGPVSSFVLPSVQGAAGVFANRVFAQEDTSRRAFGPSALPDGVTPITLRAQSLWGTHLSGCGTPNIVGTAYQSPDGILTGASLVAPGSGGLQYACMASNSLTVAPGDAIIIGTWTRSVNSNGYQNGTTLQAALQTGTWARTGTHLASAIPSNGGGGEWQWSFTWDKVATSGADTLGIQGYSSSTNQVAFYGMTALYIPASAGYSDNEIADIALHLSPLNQSAVAGDIALLPLQRFRADSALIPNVNQFLYGTAPDLTYATDDTASLQALLNLCSTPGCTVYIPPGQYKLTAPLTITGPGVNIRAAGASGGGPGSGGPQLGTVSLGCFTAGVPAIRWGTSATANYGGGSINGITFVDKASGTCAGGIQAINQSYVEFNNLGFSGFSQAATAAPATPSLTPSTSGGFLAAATYFVAIADADVNGRETLTGSAVSTAVGGSGLGSIAVATHTAASPMTCFNIYLGASATTLKLVSQCHANGTSLIQSTAPSGVPPVNFDHSPAYALNIYGTSGNLGSVSTGYSNQDIVRNIQIYNSTRNGIVFDRNTSQIKVESGNIYGSALTSGYGIIAAGAPVINIHTEAGGAGWTRAGITGPGGQIYLGMDLGSGTQTGIQAINAWNWPMISVVCGAAGNVQTAVTLDTASNGNVVIATDNTTCANPLIADSSANGQRLKIDSEAATMDVGYTLTLRNPLGSAYGGTGVASPTAHRVPIAEGASAFTFISPSTSGFCLVSNGTGSDPTFQACPSGFSNPMTTIGDMIGGTTSGAAARIVGGKTGQGIVATNGSTPAFGPSGILTGNGGTAVSGAAYLVQCDSSTAQIDRGTEVVFASGASAPVVPDPSDTGCGAGFTFRLADKNAGALTFTRETSATFDVYTGSSTLTAQTSFAMTNGQTATVFADTTSHYIVTILSSVNQSDLGTITWNNGGTCTFAAASNFMAAGQLTTVTAQSCTLSPTNLIKWGSYTLEVINGSGSAATLTLGTGGSCSAWKIRGGGSGGVTLSGASAIDVLSFSFDGTSCLGTLGTNWN